MRPQSHALPDPGSDANGRNDAQAGSSSWLAVSVLCGITLVFYYDLWLPDQVLIKRDALTFHLPIKQHLIERLSAGELPQWFPYDWLGRPFIGATATGVFHPFTALYFLLPVHDAYRTSVFLSCLLGAVGAFSLGRRLGFSPAGALIAGIAFALSGYVVSLTENILYLYSICMLPLFCLALEKALGDSSRAWTVAPAVVWATVFLIGDAQNGYYYGFIALLWVAVRAQSAYLEAGRRLLFVACLATLLAGIQLGPSAAVFAYSDRTQPALFHEQAVSWATHPVRLLTILASPVAGGSDPVEIARLFFGTPNQGLWAESLYLGIPVTGLAFLGAWYRRDLYVLVLLGGLTLLLALGQYGGLYEVLYHVVPLWSAFRYPEKLMGVVSFSAAMLAGAGLDVLRAGKSYPMPWLAAAFLSAAAGLVLYTETASAWAAMSFGAPPELTREVTRSAALAFLFSTATALGMWLFVSGATKGWLREELLIFALVTLVTLDLSRVNLEVYHTGPTEVATFTPALAKALEEREGELKPGRFRLISIDKDMVGYPANLERLLGAYGAASVERRQALRLAHNAQFHLETVYSYLPGIRVELAAMFNQRPGIEVAARYNVSYYIGRHSQFKDKRFEQAYLAGLLDYDLALFRNPAPAKPRVYLSLHPERAASPVDPAALITRPDFLSGKVDVIELSGESLPGPATAGTARIERYAPEEVRVRVDTPQPAVLILLDAYDKGWTATLENGEETPILRANALVRAVIVPAGTHVVTFSYQTPLLKAGAWASLTGVLLCAGLIAHGFAIRRRAAD